MNNKHIVLDTNCLLQSLSRRSRYYDVWESFIYNNKTEICMRLKFFCLLILAAVNTWSQDVIVKKDGSTILSKVLEVNTTDIKYKKKFKSQWTNIYAFKVGDSYY